MSPKDSGIASQLWHFLNNSFQNKTQPLPESVSSTMFTQKTCSKIMQLERLYKSTMQMTGIAIHLHFQPELSSVFLHHSIPLGALYVNGPQISTFCNSEKNSVHLQFLHRRLSLSLSAFQRPCLSCLEKKKLKR